MDSARDGTSEGARRWRRSGSCFDDTDGERSATFLVEETIMGWKKDIVTELEMMREYIAISEGYIRR